MKTKRCDSSILIILVLVLFSFITFSSASVAFCAEEKKDLPPRAISIAPEYTGIIVEGDDGVSIDLKVYNKGRSDENINVFMDSIPKGWEATIKTYSFMVTGVHVNSDESKELTLRLEPDKDTGPGSYTFRVKAQTEDRRLSSSVNVNIDLREKEVVEEKKVEGLEITTSYPVLQGPTDAKFEFSIDVKSKVDKDSIFNLSAIGPENWDINFKPAYESKYISSLRIQANSSQTMAVEVNPLASAEPGEYQVKVKVDSPEAHGEVDLTIVLTGTHKIDVVTADGRLSLNALQGKPANLSFYVKNSGSAVQNNISFVSIKPENWKVEFTPENIGTLNPGDLKQVEATITPSDQALVGDYSVVLNIDSGKISEAMELRVSVRASAAWAWIGIGIILLVIIGLVILFIRLGRR